MCLYVLDTHLGLVLLGQRVGGHSPKVHTCKKTSKTHYPNTNSISYSIFVNYFIIANTWHFLPFYFNLMALSWHGVMVLIWTLWTNECSHTRFHFRGEHVAHLLRCSQGSHQQPLLTCKILIYFTRELLFRCMCCEYLPPPCRLPFYNHNDIF